MSEPNSERPSWVTPIVVLTGISLLSFLGLYWIDVMWTGSQYTASTEHISVHHRFLNFDPESISNSLSQLAAMIAAVFGIVITVVSIIVQLSADRYTGVARMFLRDRVNMSVFGFYLVVCVTGVWTSFALQSHFVPRVAIIGILLATTL